MTTPDHAAGTIDIGQFSDQLFRLSCSATMLSNKLPQEDDHAFHKATTVDYGADTTQVARQALSMVHSLLECTPTPASNSLNAVDSIDVSDVDDVMDSTFYPAVVDVIDSLFEVVVWIWCACR
jgi:hypothetical protein